MDELCFEWDTHSFISFTLSLYIYLYKIKYPVPIRYIIPHAPFIFWCGRFAYFFFLNFSIQFWCTVLLFSVVAFSPYSLLHFFFFALLFFRLEFFFPCAQRTGTRSLENGFRNHSSRSYTLLYTSHVYIMNFFDIIIMQSISDDGCILCGPKQNGLIKFPTFLLHIPQCLMDFWERQPFFIFLCLTHLLVYYRRSGPLK